MHPNITEYARRNQLCVSKSLGAGVHGSVFVGTDATEGQSAIKYHYEADPFYREVEIYIRLDELRVRKVSGFNVPRLLGFDEELRVLQISLVSRPFILDFGGAYLDFKPQFTEEIWAEWEAKRREEYGER